MKNFKKVIAVLLTAVLLLTSAFAGLSVVAEGNNTATITVDTVAGTAGQIVDVPVKITTTGMSGVILKVTLDDGLAAATETGYTASADFPEVYADYFDGEYEIAMLSNDCLAVSGENLTLVTLNLAVAEDVTAEELNIAIEVAEGNACDADENDVALTLNNGKVTIAPAEVEGPAVVTNMYSGSTSYAEFEYETLEEALAEVMALAEVKHGNKWCDPTVTLNTDVTLTADIEVPEFTTLVLGDNVITKGDYEVNIAGSGKVVANYAIDFWAGNPFVVLDEDAGVYTYSVNYQMYLNNKSLTLKDEIFINFFAKPTITYEGEVEYGFDYYWAANPEAVTTVASEDFLPDSNYKAKTVGVPAKDMSNEVVARFWAKTVVDDVEYFVYSNTIVYSVSIYANNMLNNDDESDDELLKNLVNYGASFQVVKNHNLDKLANSFLSEEDKVLPSVDELKTSEAWTPALEVSNLKDYSQASTYVEVFSLQLLDVINVKYNLNRAPAAGVEHVMCVWTKAEYEALTANCTSDEEISAVLTAENCNNVLNVSEDGNFFLVEGIPSKKYANTIISRSMYVDANGETQYDWLWSYSPIQYCINTINKAPSEADVNLSIALMLYANSARQFFDYTVDAE